ncbi:MAG: inverse autotransporter beta domain-containing protein [Hyphomicrobiales bacterium]|nr:inverse autotransporter beta domain-containing protein [Hyphomicrobiales bacterium]
MKPSAKLLLLPVVSLLFGVTASSHANEALFSKSSRTLEQLWSGTLECHDHASANAGFTPRNRFDSDGATSSLDEPERRDYAECARQSLRNSSSRALIETIEDGVRHGGVALLGERFRLDSSVSWVWGENVRGELDAVIPVWGKEYSDGTGSALFIQPGAALWNGLEGDERVDANLGMVYRSHLNAETVAGGSFFYDHDFKNGHNRLGAGVDVQSGVMHLSANYYHPISDWRESRENHEEQALQGVDFSLGLALDKVRLSGTLGVWRFEGDLEQDKNDWRPSIDVEGGYQVLPGVFLEGGYEHHDGKNSLDSRWRAGLAFRFSLPSLEGATVKSKSMAEPNLWQTARREKRILYEERTKIVPSVASIETAATIEEGGDPFTMTFAFDKPLEREVTILLAPTSDSTANPEEYTLSAHAIVSPPESLAGEELSTDTETENSRGHIEMILPRHTTSLNLTFAVNNDEVGETDELVRLAAHTTGENAQYARFDGVMEVTILHNDNFTIGFADASSSVEENAGTAYLLLQLGHAAPVGGVSVNVDAAGATDDIAFASSASITVPAGTPEGQVAQSVASIAIDIIDDNDAEASETVTFTISEGSGFPASPWQIDPDAATHTMTILASDPLKGDVGFAPGNPASAKEGDTLTLTVMSSATADADLPVTWTAAPAGKVQTATGTVTIANGSDSQTFSLDINDDSASGPAGSITVTLAAPDLPNGWSLGNNTSHAVAIDNNGVSPDILGPTTNVQRTVNFADASTPVNEGASVSTTLSVSPTPDGEVKIPVLIPADTDAYTITVAPAEALSDGEITFNADRPSVTLTLNAPEDDGDTGDESVRVTLGTPLPSNYSPGSNAAWAVNIADNDVPAIPEAEKGGTVGFAPRIGSYNSYFAFEGTSLQVLVAVLPFDGTATTVDLPLAWEVTQGADNIGGARSGTVAVEQGSASSGFNLVIADDSQAEPNERVTITLTRGAGLPNEWKLASATHTFTILANDNIFTLSPPLSNTISENTGTSIALNFDNDLPSQAYLRIGASGVSSGDITITPDKGADFRWDQDNTGGTLVIPEDTSSPVTLNIAVENDSTLEPGSTLAFALDETYASTRLPRGWSIDPSGNTQTLTVVGIPPAAKNTIGFETTKVPVEEDDEIVLNAVLKDSDGTPLATSGAEAIALNVSVAAGGEETSFSGTSFVIPANSTLENGAYRIENFSIRRDGDPELEETLTLSMTQGANFPSSGWEIDSLANSIDFIIAPNDNIITFSVPSFAEIPENGGSATITATINQPIPAGETATVAITPSGDATSDDYNFSVSEGSISGNTWTLPTQTSSATITVTAIDNSVSAEDKTLRLGFTGASLPAGWRISANTYRDITILEDEKGGTVGFAPRIGSYNSYFAFEGTSLQVLVAVLPFDGTATTVDLPLAWEVTQGADNIDGASSGTVTVEQGFASSGFNLAVADDSEAELNERVTITLTRGAGLPDEWKLASATHTFTILANDNIFTLSPPLSNTISENTGTSIALNFDNDLPSQAYLRIGVSGVSSGDITITPDKGANFSGSQDNTGGTLTIPEGTSSPVTLNIAAGNDSTLQPGSTLTFTLDETYASTRLPRGWSIGTSDNSQSVTIIGDNPVDRTLAFALPSSEFTEPANENASHFVTINVVGTLPSGGFPLMVTVGNESTASNSDYSVTPPLSNILVSNTTVVDGVLTLDFSIFADDIPETDETIELSIPAGQTLPDGWSVVSPSTHTINLPDNDEFIGSSGGSSTKLTKRTQAVSNREWHPFGLSP